MIKVTTRKDQNVALFGLGGSGMVTAQALMAGGADLVAFDDNPQKVEEAKELGITTGDLREYDFSKADAFVLSPGVPLTHPKPHWSVELANAHKVPIIGDVQLFADELREHAPQATFIAITGTNGKSTTTALISHILAHAGCNVFMGGNIGRAVLSLDELSDDGIYVVECSSYQIDLAPTLDPDIGILLNLAPDHLERHGTMENYAQIKFRLLEGSKKPILGIDDAYTQKFFTQNKIKNLEAISVKAKVENGAFGEGDEIIFCEQGNCDKVISLNGIASLLGQHNLQNSCAAYLACHHAGLSNEAIQNGLSSFPSLAHRMEILGNLEQIRYVNDSKGTNADATAMALASFEHIYWIAGGLAKDGGIEALRPLFGNIAKAYLIGEAAPEFAATLGRDVPFEITDTLDVAVQRASVDASEAGCGVVLLSPACASFDQFANFELRGEAFRSAVLELDRFLPFRD